MTYFELFDIPIALKVDAASLSARFFQLSRETHPDYFVSAGADAQAEALDKSALLNKAWLTFRNPDETIKYVLQLKGLLEEEERYVLPPDFLMEVMEINEQLMDSDDPDVAASVGASINRIQHEIYEPVQEIVESYQEGITSEEALLRVKEYYYKKKYLDRIRRELAGKQ